MIFREKETRQTIGLFHIESYFLYKQIQRRGELQARSTGQGVERGGWGTSIPAPSQISFLLPETWPAFSKLLRSWESYLNSLGFSFLFHKIITLILTSGVGGGLDRIIPGGLLFGGSHTWLSQEPGRSVREQVLWWGPVCHRVRAQLSGPRHLVS